MCARIGRRCSWTTCPTSLDRPFWKPVGACPGLTPGIWYHSLRLAEMLGYDPGVNATEVRLSPRGFRMLRKMPRLPAGVIDNVVERFDSLEKALSASAEELEVVEGVGVKRARDIKEGFVRLRELNCWSDTGRGAQRGAGVMIGSVMSRIRKRGGDLVGAYHGCARRRAGCLAAVWILDRTSLSRSYEMLLIGLAALVGAVIGLLIGGPLGRQFQRLGGVLDRATAKVSAAALFITAIGLVVGLGIGALGSMALFRLPVIGIYLLPLLFMFTGYIFAYVAFRRHADIARLFGLKNLPASSGRGMVSPKVLDTSAIIDARIGDIVPTLFLEGELILPGFVLEELQSIADSTEPLRRARGRRGLECVEALRAGESRLVILDRDYPGLGEVDAKLIKLAKELDAKIVTTDFNLNKVAQIQGVEVLNVNNLANALKPVVLPGESLHVRVVREGKEEDQGVAYLDDGTMVVIEGGRYRVGQEVVVEVTSVLQNPAGKMVFGRLSG